MNIKEFSVKVRRRETPFYDRIYRIAKYVRRFEIPTISPLYKLLHYERKVRLNLWHNSLRVFYTQRNIKLPKYICGCLAINWIEARYIEPIHQF